MIQRTPQERTQYELRLKAQRDERARLQHAQAEGEAKGVIKALRDVLGLESSSLDGVSLEQLEQLASDLQRQVRERDV